jgi:hypothetical protein
MGWIGLCRDTVQWLVLVDTAANLLVQFLY